MSLVKVDVSGPLFQPDAGKRMHDAVAQGLLALGEIGAETMKYSMLNYKLVRTGRTVSSIRVIQRRKAGTAGYVFITPTDVWGGVISVRRGGLETYTTKKGKVRQRRIWHRSVLESHNNRPTRSWLAFGERKGRRLRRTSDFYARTIYALNKVKKQGIFAPPIVEALS
jgi:hypothetical protein